MAFELTSLRYKCLQLLATGLLPAAAESGAPADTAAAAAAAVGVISDLPVEVQVDLLLLLAGCWQLLSPPALLRFGWDDLRPILTALPLGGCALLTAASLRGGVFCAALPTLLSLDLRGVADLADADVGAMLAHCPALRELTLAQCPRLSAAALEHAAARCPELEALNVAECWRVDIVAPLRALSRLTALDISGCWKVRLVCTGSVSAFSGPAATPPACLPTCLPACLAWRSALTRRCGWPAALQVPWALRCAAHRSSPRSGRRCGGSARPDAASSTTAGRCGWSHSGRTPCRPPALGSAPLST
jgi:hypothetical protein